MLCCCFVALGEGGGALGVDLGHPGGDGGGVASGVCDGAVLEEFGVARGK